MHLFLEPKTDLLPCQEHLAIYTRCQERSLSSLWWEPDIPREKTWILERSRKRREKTTSRTERNVKFPNIEGSLKRYVQQFNTQCISIFVSCCRASAYYPMTCFPKLFLPNQSHCYTPRVSSHARKATRIERPGCWTSGRRQESVEVEMADHLPPTLKIRPKFLGSQP